MKELENRLSLNDQNLSKVSESISERIEKTEEKMNATSDELKKKSIKHDEALVSLQNLMKELESKVTLNNQNLCKVSQTISQRIEKTDDKITTSSDELRRKFNKHDEVLVSIQNLLKDLENRVSLNDENLSEMSQKIEETQEKISTTSEELRRKINKHDESLSTIAIELSAHGKRIFKKKIKQHIRAN